MLPILLNVFTPISNSINPLASLHTFFIDIINNPFNHTMELTIFAAACAGITAGLVYLVRRHLEKKKALALSSKT